MAIKSGFFMSVGGDRKYKADFFAKYFASFIGNGVFPNPSTNLQAISNNDMSVTLRPGKAWINGYILFNDNDYILNIESADGVLNRIDRIVARYDTADREIRLEVKKGTFASIPSAPNLQRDADAYELALADIYVGKGSISINQANITDLRLNKKLCGIVHGAVDQVDTTTIFNQYQAWLRSMQNVLDGDVAANLASRILSLEQDLDTHLIDYVGFKNNIEALEYEGDKLLLKVNGKRIELGHIKVDGKTIFINENGEISLNNPNLDDFSDSPGSKILIAGTMEEGFFGEVPASELITGDALASQVGISQGSSQHSTAGWLKFAYKGDIQFVAKKPIRYYISWNDINAAKCVYGDKTITIDGLTYKVTLMRGANDKFNPKQPISGQIGGGNGYDGEVNHGSEWNRLMCQIHEQSLDKSWYYPTNIERDIGILEHSLGTGNQGMYSDADLVVRNGNGKASWCQEMSTSTSHRLHRGSIGVSHSASDPSSDEYRANSWRPVLRLVP